MVRPETAFAESWPILPIVTCKPDFSDLKGVISNIIANYDSYLDARISAYHLAQQGCNNKVLAKRLATIIESCLINQT